MKEISGTAYSRAFFDHLGLDFDQLDDIERMGVMEVLRLCAKEVSDPETAYAQVYGKGDEKVFAYQVVRALTYSFNDMERVYNPMVAARSTFDFSNGISLGAEAYIFIHNCPFAGADMEKVKEAYELTQHNARKHTPGEVGKMRLN